MDAMEWNGKTNEGSKILFLIIIAPEHEEAPAVGDQATQQAYGEYLLETGLEDVDPKKPWSSVAYLGWRRQKRLAAIPEQQGEITDEEGQDQNSADEGSSDTEEDGHDSASESAEAQSEEEVEEDEDETEDDDDDY